MSTVKVDTIKTTGNVEVYTCKAWVNFDGTQTAGNMIRASGNVSSITDNGTGNFTVNFATAMTDVNYAVASSQAFNNNVVSTGNTTNPPINNNFATGSFRYSTPNSAGNVLDSVYNYVAVFR
jgi:hypothetical protein